MYLEIYSTASAAIEHPGAFLVYIKFNRSNSLCIIVMFALDRNFSFVCFLHQTCFLVKQRAPRVTQFGQKVKQFESHNSPYWHWLMKEFDVGFKVCTASRMMQGPRGKVWFIFNIEFHKYKLLIAPRKIYLTTLQAPRIGLLSRDKSRQSHQPGKANGPLPC